MKNSHAVLAAAVAVALLGAGCADRGNDDEGGAGGGSGADYPERDINVTVPFGAGGSTDLTARTVGEAMGEFYGNNLVVTNTTGAGGSVGTQHALTATNDGYTILADGMLSFTSMPVMDTLDTMPQDWDFWLATYTPNVIAVAADSPYRTIDDLIQAMSDAPGEISAGSAGPGSAGHLGAEIFSSAAGVEYQHVPFDGGNPAIVATLAGEVDFNAQLLVEMQDMLISGDLRGLATFADEPLELDGGITIPTLAEALPELADTLPLGETTGFAVPSGLDENILARIDEGFETAMEDQNFLDFCAENGMTPVAMGREEAADEVAHLQSIVAWTLQDAGVAVNDPEELGIPQP